MRDVLPTPPVASEVLSDADLAVVCGGKEAWQVIGPIVQPILYPPKRLFGGGTAQASGSCGPTGCK
jgi:hypothetical protein